MRRPLHIHRSRHWQMNQRLTLIAGAIITTACTRRAPGLRVPDTTRGPTAVLVDSVTLHDPDSLPLGAYTSFFARAHDGRVFITDMQLRRVLEFGHDRHFVRAFGKPGGGPLEFVLPATAGLIDDDSVLAVTDVNRSTMALFSTATDFQDAGSRHRAGLGHGG